MTTVETVSRVDGHTLTVLTVGVVGSNAVDHFFCSCPQRWEYRPSLASYLKLSPGAKTEHVIDVWLKHVQEVRDAERTEVIERGMPR